MILIAVLIRIVSSGPVLFRQERIGLNGTRFMCLKFRTMKTDASAQLAELLQNNPIARSEWEATRKLKDDPRITAVGTHVMLAS